MVSFLAVSFLIEAFAFSWHQDYLTNQLNEKYIVIEANLEDLINQNFNVIKGLIAYLKTNDTLQEDTTESFIDELINFEKSYLRNIAILEDTTIIWNFPKAMNASSIGIDLAEIPEQRDQVLKVKNEGKILFHGPVDLVQGGLGFIMRIPFDRQQVYFGQISAVFDGNRLIHYLQTIEKNYDLYLQLENDHGILYASNFIRDPKDLIQTIDSNLFNWEIRLQPKEGWQAHSIWYTFIPFLILIVTILLGHRSYVFLSSFEDHRNNAIHDSLTGLYNRHYLYHYAEKVLNIAKINQNCLGVMVIDINDFKYINDTYGHQVGDQVLINFASKLKLSLRNGQEVFRIGGDEFLLIFENTLDEKLFQSIGIRIKSSVEQYPIIDSYDFKITISLGTALFPNDGLIFDELYNKADREMYSRKDSNK